MNGEFDLWLTFLSKSFLIYSLRRGTLGYDPHLNSVGERTRKRGILTVSQGLCPEAGMDGIDVFKLAPQARKMNGKSFCPFSSVSQSVLRVLEIGFGERQRLCERERLA